MTTVQLATDWEDPDGVTHQPDDVVEISDPLARRLIFLGKARKHEPAQAPDVEVASPTEEESDQPEKEPDPPADPRRARLNARKDKSQ